MFGLTPLKIIIILLVLILVFGGWRTGRMLGKTYDTYRKVDNTRREVRRKFSLTNLLGLREKEKGSE
jgi:Sec-independent protein translocase protein TatA